MSFSSKKAIDSKKLNKAAKFMTEPKSNHYIPQFYISQWKFNDNQVYHLDKKQSKIINTNPRNILADRIWDSKVENWFTQAENKFWIPVIDKILKNKTMDLSERELESFLSFFLTLKVRDKDYVDESYKLAESNLTKFDSESIREGKSTKEQIEELKKNIPNKDIFDYSFLSSFTPASLFREGSSHNQLKRLSFGTKVILEEDMKYGQFLTSNHPSQMTSQMIGENEVCLKMMIALSPNLLVFGAKEVETFVALNNKPINIFIKEFNQEIYNDSKSKYIISNKKSLLEQFLS